MPHAKFDDLYDDKRKIKRAWRAHPPNPIGVHAMAITYCQRQKLDGKVPDDWLEELMPKPPERRRIIDTMVTHRLLDDDPHDDGRYRVHDFLEWNESAAERETRSQAARAAVNTRHQRTNGSAVRNA